jgi:hypothetical protein
MESSCVIEFLIDGVSVGRRSNAFNHSDLRILMFVRYTTTAKSQDKLEEHPEENSNSAAWINR